MIGKLLDSTLKTVVDTIGILIVASILVVGTTTVLVHVLGLMNVVQGTDSILSGGKVSTLIGTGITLILGTLIVHERKLSNDLLSILLVAGGVWLAHTTGVLLGLVPIALLTTIHTTTTKK